MFTIGEFARIGDISVRMLRHYDEIGLLRPATVDPATGYRGYSIAQLRDLNRIVALRGLGFSLAEVRALLSGITGPELRGMLLLRRAELELQLEAGQARLARVEARLRAIEREDELADDIVIKTAPDQRLLAVSRPIPGFGPDNITPVLNPAYDVLAGIVAAMGLSPDRVYLSCYDTSGEQVIMFVGTPVPESVTEVPAPAVLALLPGVQVGSCVRQGTAREVWPRIVHDVMAWIAGIRDPGAAAAPVRPGARGGAAAAGSYGRSVVAGVSRPRLNASATAAARSPTPSLA